MFYTVALYTSLLIFGIGLMYKITTWFRFNIGIHAMNATTSDRIMAALRGLLGVFFSIKLLTLVRVLIVDVLLQLRILKEDFLRWLMHMMIYAGFILLLLMHALDKIITVSLFSGYASTLNPFMFLRDFFGFMVIIGIGIAVFRRFVLKVPRLNTNAMDTYAIIIVAVIMCSGILFEGLKITSYTRFREMVADYGDSQDEQALKALESYWVDSYGLASPNVKGPFEQTLLEQGRELNEGCLSCHSQPKWAFTGYAVAKSIRPVAFALDQAGLTNVLWYIHILACFLGLAYLPFSKMFHIFATPVSLLANAVMDRENSNPVNIATRQAMELDACTHCSSCSQRCSVAIAFEVMGNINILPSEKMTFLKDYIRNKVLDQKGLKAIQEGIYLCTNCDRCTVVCPSGINLRELWFSVREELLQKGLPVPLILTPFSYYRGLSQKELKPERYLQPLTQTLKTITENFDLIHKPDEVLMLTPANKEFKEKIDRSPVAGSYSYCFACENCTTVCPVVENYENPQEVLDLLPHQIMRSVGLGLKDLAMGSRMLWDCLTCYQCQEHCPQGVKVTDILFELKNLAVR